MGLFTKSKTGNNGFVSKAPKHGRGAIGEYSYGIPEENTFYEPIQASNAESDNDCANMRYNIDNTDTSKYTSAIEAPETKDENDIIEDTADEQSQAQSESPSLKDRLKAMSNRGYDDAEKAFGKPIDDIIEDILAWQRNRTTEMLKQKSKDAFDENIDRALFYTGGMRRPYAKDFYIDELFKEYGIGTYSGEPLMWFEQLPMCAADDYKEALEEATPEEIAIARELEGKYENDLSCAKRRHRSQCVDYLRIARYEEEHKHYSFDTRECWNLDSVIPLFIYPRLKHLKLNAYGFPAIFESMEEYEKEVLDPILEGLELQILLDGDPYFIIMNYMEENGMESHLGFDVELRVQERLAQAYHLIADNITGFWD